MRTTTATLTPLSPTRSPAPSVERRPKAMPACASRKWRTNPMTPRLIWMRVSRTRASTPTRKRQQSRKCGSSTPPPSHPLGRAIAGTRLRAISPHRASAKATSPRPRRSLEFGPTNGTTVRQRSPRTMTKTTMAVMTMTSAARAASPASSWRLRASICSRPHAGRRSRARPAKTATRRRKMMMTTKRVPSAPGPPERRGPLLWAATMLRTISTSMSRARCAKCSSTLAGTSRTSLSWIPS
mmetsp:Transcript_22317/g.63463  ORF Transcript_22317/g.63463 Transcript_22317/m.63463 type:complete len:240 (-) Transcript_22317:56-775(-)